MWADVVGMMCGVRLCYATSCGVVRKSRKKEKSMGVCCLLSESGVDNSLMPYLAQCRQLTSLDISSCVLSADLSQLLKGAKPELFRPSAERGQARTQEKKEKKGALEEDDPFFPPVSPPPCFSSSLLVPSLQTSAPLSATHTHTILDTSPSPPLVSPAPPAPSPSFLVPTIQAPESLPTLPAGILPLRFLNLSGKMDSCSFFALLWFLKTLCESACALFCHTQELIFPSKSFGLSLALHLRWRGFISLSWSSFFFSKNTEEIRTSTCE